MKKNRIKMMAVAALAGTMFQFGGCGFGGIFNALIRTAPSYAALEFLTDADGFFGQSLSGLLGGGDGADAGE